MIKKYRNFFSATCLADTGKDRHKYISVSTVARRGCSSPEMRCFVTCHVDKNYTPPLVLFPGSFKDQSVEKNFMLNYGRILETQPWKWCELHTSFNASTGGSAPFDKSTSIQIFTHLCSITIHVTLK